MSSRRVKVQFEGEVDIPLTEVENKFFENQTIKLNGYHFINCRFAGCILWADNSLFILDCCFFVNCQILEALPTSTEPIH